MLCVYCHANMTTTIVEWCHARRDVNNMPRPHSPWVFEPIEPTEKEY